MIVWALYVTEYVGEDSTPIEVVHNLYQTKERAEKSLAVISLMTPHLCPMRVDGVVVLP